MEVIIALDIGDRRIGIASANSIIEIPLPLETYTRKSLKEDLEYLKKLMLGKSCTKIVCGLPLNTDGSESEQTKKTLFFVEKLKEVISLPIEMVDERYSTMQATEVLLEADMSRKKRKQVVDKVAASFILEYYLNSRKR